MSSKSVRALVALSFALLVVTPAFAQIDARMLRYPSLSQAQIAFVYAGDVWLVSRTGGAAHRLTTSAGEESFPRFSPDGTKVAFTANYDGNQDVYVMPVTGGEPTRLTFHPMPDRVVGWTPDGSRVLFVSGRESGRQRYNQFYTVSLEGGLPEKLPIPYGEFGAYAEDGHRFAYMPMSTDFRTWKRYRGGWSPDLFIFDLEKMTSENITNNPAQDAQPMWSGDNIYFISDRGANERHNIWVYEGATKQTRQITHFTDYDVTFPSIGPGGIVFQAGGRLYLLDIASGQHREVPVSVVTDRSTLRVRTEKVANLIAGATISPTGKRALFYARGDVFSAPAEHGPVVNLTQSSGVAERFPRWSPDGKWIAVWSDATVEYELTLKPADGAGADRTITKLGPGFRYPVSWSPDSTKVAYIDNGMRIRVTTIGTSAADSQTEQIDQSPEWMGHGQNQGFDLRWSSDSRWLTYARPTGDANSAIFIYDTRDKTVNRVTSGYFNDHQPVFDPDGKYLYYASDREFDPVYGAFDNSWTYPNPTKLIAVPLRKDVASPLAARNDAETAKKDDEGATAEDNGRKNDTAKNDDAAKKDAKPVAIDFEGFEARAVVLPPDNGNYGNLQAVPGKLLYSRFPRTGSGQQDASIVYYDLAEREEKTVLENAPGFEVSADGKKMLVVQQGRYAILDVKAGVKFEKPIATADMEAPVDPRAEWKQMFNDAYRFMRDYFYDETMHGVDWAAERDRYARLLEDAVTRWDVDFVLGEFIGELNASHTYNQGGVHEAAPARNVGMLGVDWELAFDRYRIKRIVRGGVWDTDVVSPLARPGVDVSEGDYVLAVNGVPIDATRDPWAAFQGLGNKTVLLTVNSKPGMEGARQVVVQTLNSEVELRFRDWIEQRRQIVDTATNGRAGYIYVQSTGVDAQNELVRQFMAQWRKDGLVIDERWNSGGQIPDRFIELLNRPMLAFWAVRDGQNWQWPPVAHRGAMVMLINGWSGSGGDAFPNYFRDAGLGPLIGTRTWGGLIGISGVPALVDGGVVTVPTFRMFSPAGEWFREGHGVEPDIHVPEDPAALAKGSDPQLERAIQEVMDRIAKLPPPPARPAPEKRTAGGGQ